MPWIEGWPAARHQRAMFSYLRYYTTPWWYAVSLPTLVAIIGGVLVSLVGTLGLRSVFSLVRPERWLAERQPAPAKA